MSLFKRIKRSLTGSIQTDDYESRVISRNNNKTRSTFDPQILPPEISEREVEILKDCWNTVQQDVAKVGIITFVGLFETHPDVHDAFMSFRAVNTSDLEYNAILRAHALRVMGTVNKCIYRLDNRDKLQELMTEMGIRHKNYSVKIEFIDLMGPQFISSIKASLETVWTDEHEKAWDNLFKVMCYHMRKGMCSI
ncbi:CYGB1-like protein [Mya arenaria]|uniref:CYGB1-like protein n=1 Tax=Mya arenaria TaxID=6604 RepID=A0ABY7F2Z0_MYAAR|nr:cytoglobin-1-like [Mya arenaria]WAR15139.1 CYGB1-like protein [Mya arenaria]